jgi:hypothetical protein
MNRKYPAPAPAEQRAGNNEHDERKVRQQHQRRSKPVSHRLSCMTGQFGRQQWWTVRVRAKFAIRNPHA